MPADTVRLWDPFVRLFHWTVAGVFVGNYFINEKGEDVHIALGYTAVTLLLLRFVWGFVGPRSARWADFFPTASRLKSHFSALVKGERYRRLGHTPIGALVMLLMMLCLLCLGITGFMMTEVDYFWGVEWVKDVHGTAANSLLGLVTLHILAALYESWRLKENLPLSMITGRRRQ